MRVDQYYPIIFIQKRIIQYWTSCAMSAIPCWTNRKMHMAENARFKIVWVAGIQLYVLSKRSP